MLIAPQRKCVHDEYGNVDPAKQALANQARLEREAASLSRGQKRSKSELEDAWDSSPKRPGRALRGNAAVTESEVRDASADGGREERSIILSQPAVVITAARPQSSSSHTTASGSLDESAEDAVQLIPTSPEPSIHPLGAGAASASGGVLIPHPSSPLSEFARSPSAPAADIRLVIPQIRESKGDFSSPVDAKPPSTKTLKSATPEVGGARGSFSSTSSRKSKAKTPATPVPNTATSSVFDESAVDLEGESLALAKSLSLGLRRRGSRASR
jgi:hypothetical protein